VEQINLYYISLVIDNSQDSDIRRKNIDFEIKTMDNLLRHIDTVKINSFNIICKNELALRYSFIFNYNFMNYIVQDEINYSDKNKSNFFDLLAHGIVTRPISQWIAITQILDDLDIEAEICLEKGGGIQSRLDLLTKNNSLDYQRYPYLMAFSRYQMPLFYLDRENMMSIAKENNWLSILQQTWSCWYPKNGEVCGSCFACVRRPNF
jgi:hypothetical protein